MALRIDELFAFIAENEEGEGVTGFSVGHVFMPMVAADRERVDSLRERAQMIATASGRAVRLVRFSVREELETYLPDGAADNDGRAT